MKCPVESGVQGERQHRRCGLLKLVIVHECALYFILRKYEFLDF